MLHVGALRDALFKHLFANHHHGVNILRIEDTDQTRYSPESEAEFISTLEWVGIGFQEGPHIDGPNGPYRQSERKQAGIYQPHIEKLMALGHAYKAFDTPEELAEMRKVQEAAKQSTGYYGGAWRDATPQQVAEAEAAGKPFVIRQRIPRDTVISINDAIRGHVEWDSNTIDDPVLIKADGMPTYHFASMVDDHLMGISHIIRGEEWLSSAPKHAALFDAFGWKRPIFVHCPVIVGTDGKKLSKRHGATRVLDYAAQGYLPGALKNFIALIGWSPGDDREAMTEAELIEAFDLKGLQPSPGKFDIDKLRWLNGLAIRALEPDDLLDVLIDYLHTPYTFGDLPHMDEKAVQKWFFQPHTIALFDEMIEKCSTSFGEDTMISDYEAALRGFQEAHGLEKLGPVVHPTRVALTGKTTGPGLFELMGVLGPERMKKRFQHAKELATPA